MLMKLKLTIKPTNDPSTKHIFLDVKRQLHVSATRGSHHKAVQRYRDILNIHDGYDHNPQVNFFCGAATQRGSWPPHSRGFLDHTQRRSTVGRTPLDE